VNAEARAKRKEINRKRYMRRYKRIGQKRGTHYTAEQLTAATQRANERLAYLNVSIKK
jgi:hypothetical protein